MGLSAALDGTRDFIINNMTGFTLNNCSVNNEDIFDYIQTTDAAVKKCVLVSPETFSAGTASEFRSSTIFWGVLINVFFMVADDDIVTPLTNTIAFVDEFVLDVSRDSSLDLSVGTAKIVGGGPLLTYKRSSYLYYLFPLEINVRENIS